MSIHYLCPACNRFEDLSGVAKVRGGADSPCEVIYLCFECVVDVYGGQPFRARLNLWQRASDNCHRYPMYFSTQAPRQEVIKQQGAYMPHPESKKIVEFLKLQIERFKFSTSVVDIQKVKQAKDCLEAEGKLIQARNRLRGLVKKNTELVTEVAGLSDAVGTLERDLNALKVRDEAAKRSRSDAILNAHLMGVSSPVKGQPRLSDEIDELSLTITSAREKASSAIEKKKANDATIGQAVQEALDAYLAIIMGPLFYFQDQMESCITEYVAFLALLGQRGRFMGFDVSFSEDSMDTVQARIRGELADILSHRRTQ